MNRHPALCAALTGLGLLGGGCAVETPQADHPTDETVAGLSSSTPTYVTLRRDIRSCDAPYCGGYFARDVNKTAPEQYIATLDFSQADLDVATIRKVFGAPAEELVLRGKLGPRALNEPRYFVVLEAYRGMPGVAIDPRDAFYEARPQAQPEPCYVAPCNQLLARRLNTNEGTRAYTATDVTRAAKPMVDKGWLLDRIQQHNALVSAHFSLGRHFPAGDEVLLDVSQVFVRLPDVVGPCPPLVAQRCLRGTRLTYRRNEDRCLITTECVIPQTCTLTEPSCDPGYVLRFWESQPDTCYTFVCDPCFAGDPT